jgi:hypothetical protein
MERCTKFWSLYHEILPNLANFTRYCMTMTPSSAAAERVFSMLKNSFTIGQMRQSLEDYTEGSVMMQYRFCIFDQEPRIIIFRYYYFFIKSTCNKGVASR